MRSDHALATPLPPPLPTSPSTPTSAAVPRAAAGWQHHPSHPKEEVGMTTGSLPSHMLPQMLNTAKPHHYSRGMCRTVTSTYIYKIICFSKRWLVPHPVVPTRASPRQSLPGFLHRADARLPGQPRALPAARSLLLLRSAFSQGEKTNKPKTPPLRSHLSLIFSTLSASNSSWTGFPLWRLSGPRKQQGPAS